MLQLDNTVLVITGCIAPDKNVSKLVLKDTQKRYSQYKESILWYLSESKFKKIIFCDNSDFGVDTAFLEDIKGYGKEFEWLSFKGDSKKVIECGKGWGEGEIVQYVLSNSALIKDASAFCKVTGRLIINNIDTFISKAQNKNTYFWTTGSQLKAACNKIDTRFYCIPTEVYVRFFKDAYKNTDDDHGIYLERTFYDAWKDAPLSSNSMFWFPQFKGMSGSMGREYNESSVKIFMKSVFAGLGFYAPRRT